MLVLGVDAGDYITIGDDIKVRVIKKGNIFRLAIDAPRDMEILRKKHVEAKDPDAAAQEDELYKKADISQRKKREKVLS